MPKRIFMLYLRFEESLPGKRYRVRIVCCVFERRSNGMQILASIWRYILLPMLTPCIYRQEMQKII